MKRTRARCIVLRRRFISLCVAKSRVFLHIRQFSQHAHKHGRGTVAVCVRAHLRPNSNRATFIVVAFALGRKLRRARSLVCVFRNVESNLRIARLRAENETTICTTRMRAKETDASIGNMHNDDCDCAMVFSVRVCVCLYSAIPHEIVCMLFVRYCTAVELCGNVIPRYQFSLKMAVNASMCFGIFVASQ